jgi:hypothetical protein
MKSEYWGKEFRVHLSLLVMKALFAFLPRLIELADQKAGAARYQGSYGCRKARKQPERPTDAAKKYDERREDYPVLVGCNCHDNCILARISPRLCLTPR